MENPAPPAPDAPAFSPSSDTSASNCCSTTKTRTQPRCCHHSHGRPTKRGTEPNLLLSVWPMWVPPHACKPGSAMCFMANGTKTGSTPNCIELRWDPPPCLVGCLGHLTRNTALFWGWGAREKRRARPRQASRSGSMREDVPWAGPVRVSNLTASGGRTYSSLRKKRRATMSLQKAVGQDGGGGELLRRQSCAGRRRRHLVPHHHRHSTI